MAGVYIDNQGQLFYSQWVSKGMVMKVDRDCLDHDDPEHLYNEIITLGRDPADFGVTHPLAEQYKDYTREQLINMVAELSSEVTDLHKQLARWT